MTQISTKVYQRFLTVDKAGTDQDTLTLSFSSETEVQRAFGTEILSHDESAADLSRFNDSAPVLWSHDPTQQIGVINRAWIENRKGYAQISFGNSAKAQEVKADVEAGIIRNVSIGYSIEKMEEDEEGRMIATRWRALELSFVSVAADASVGVGRSHQSYSSNNMALSQEEMIERGIIPDPKTVQTIDTGSWQESEYKREAQQFSVLEALKGFQSGRGLSGRELEVVREIEVQTGRRMEQTCLCCRDCISRR